jgi:PhzF family phenazine biosynthesis protein
MELTIYQVDAFAHQVFQGNPAAIIPLQNWLPDELLQSIAAENNLSETAYFIDHGDYLHLRWFTPAKEVRLCGHATLASAHVLFQHLDSKNDQLRFKTLGGELLVKKEPGKYVMDFPFDPPKTAAPLPLMEQALDVRVLDTVRGLDDILVRIGTEAELMTLQPNQGLVAQLPARGLIVTAPGTHTDIASRCFYPAFGIDEDPVTGSAHTLLVPYWAKLLGKNDITAVQGGTRQGQLSCALRGERVELGGTAQTYLIGKIFI